MEKEGSWNYGHSPSSYSAWGALVFQTSRAQSSGAEASREAKIQERLRITSTGNVGIGSSRPGSKLDVSGDVSIAGVATFASGTTFTGAIDANGDLDVDGHTNLDNVNIVGVTTAAGHILPATDSTYDLGSSSKYWRHVYADNVTGGGGGVIIGDDIITRNLKVNGISTHVGASIFTGNIDANGDLDVDGHTNLDNVSIAGVTTSVSYTHLTLPTNREV